MRRGRRLVGIDGLQRELRTRHIGGMAPEHLQQRDTELLRMHAQKKYRRHSAIVHCLDVVIICQLGCCAKRVQCVRFIRVHDGSTDVAWLVCFRVSGLPISMF